MDDSLSDIRDDAWKMLRTHFQALAVAISLVRDELGIDQAIGDPFQAPDVEVPNVAFHNGYDTSIETTEAFDELEEVLSQLEEAISRRDENAIREFVEYAADVWSRLQLESVAEIWDDIESVLLTLEIIEPVKIYAPEPPRIIAPKLILSAQEALIDLVRRDPSAIFGISPRAFEELIAEIFADRGFDVELTQQTRDGGRDIIAVGMALGIKSKYLIECKRYAPQRNVSLALVQRLYGVKVAERANKAILATTSGFTRDARAFATQHVWDLDLRAYDDIMQWVRQYGAA